MTLGSQVIILILSLKYELEHCERDLKAAQASIKRWCKKGMHGKRMVAILIVTEETACELGARLRPVISNLDSIENFWFLPAPKNDDVFGQHGNVDPLVHRIREAWVEARKRDKPQHVREAQRWNAGLKQWRKHR
jgi:hypothetical protein